MVKAPGILYVLAFLMGVLESGCLFNDFASARLVGRVLQTEFLFAFDLDDLGVMDGDFHGAKTQVAQRALDLAQDGCFVLAVNAT
jgi:hypothetical protein